MSESTDQPLVLSLGNEELIVSQRYETLGVINDILIAVWFVIGSILFFSESTTTAGTWLFLLGSFQLLIRPVIRLTRQIHLRKLRPDLHPGAIQSF